MGELRYHSQNSGGYWWLKDEDWRALERAGWVVDWLKIRWIDALATKATLKTDDPEAAIAEWERITSQDANAAGCSCCGQPHYFSFVDEG